MSAINYRVMEWRVMSFQKGISGSLV